MLFAALHERHRVRQRERRALRHVRCVPRKDARGDGAEVVPHLPQADRAVLLALPKRVRVMSNHRELARNESAGVLLEQAGIRLERARRDASDYHASCETGRVVDCIDNLCEAVECLHELVTRIAQKGLADS